MGKIAEIGLLNQVSLFIREGRDGFSQLLTFFLKRQHVCLIGLFLGAPRELFRLWAPIFAQLVLAREGSKRWAFCQSVAMTSWVHSSAIAASAPDRIKKAFTRGAKCANTSAKAA